jgi:pilus assembly protein TadC
MAGYLTLAGRRQRAQARLRDVQDSEAAGGSTPELILGDVTEAFSGQIPMTEQGKTELQRELRAAGLYRPTSLMEYAALRALLTITPLIAAGVATLIWAETFEGALRIWLGAVLAAMLGFSLPRLYLSFKSRMRKRAIERALPTAIDMLTLCLSAGLNVLSSLERVASELGTAYPELAVELQLVRRQADLRSLEFALQQFADRTDLDQLRNVSVLLSQSERLGTEGVSILREFADNLRLGMKQNAEAQANRAPLKMLVPGYLMGIGLLILVITPFAMEIAAFRRDNVLGNMKQESQGILKESGLGKAAGPAGTPAAQP